MVCAECFAAGRPISAQDAWQAAVALEYEIPLATNNVRDDESVEGLEIWTAQESH